MQENDISHLVRCVPELELESKLSELADKLLNGKPTIVLQYSFDELGRIHISTDSINVKTTEEVKYLLELLRTTTWKDLP